MRLVLLGPPGSGKGTQAELLVERIGLVEVGTGDILRLAVRNRTTLGIQIEPLLNQGLLVEDKIVNDLVKELFLSPNRPACFVMDGYPRRYGQAVAFDTLLGRLKMPLDAVINLTIPDDDVVLRISGRRCCPNLPACGTCYNIYAKPPKIPGKCDRCATDLILRDDDREDTVRRRLTEFHNNTRELLEFYRAKNLLRDVSATDPVETIYTNILKAAKRAAA